MTKKQLIVRGATQMPAAIKKLWGPPPVHPSESQEDYWKLAVAMAQAVEPANAIEWIYLKDVADYTWNIRELRKHQARVIPVEEEKYHHSHSSDRASNEPYFATALGKVTPPQGIRRYHRRRFQRRCAGLRSRWPRRWAGLRNRRRSNLGHRRRSGLRSERRGTGQK